MSKINAAFGLLQLKGIDEALAKRQVIDTRYRKGLKHVAGIRCADSGSHKEVLLHTKMKATGQYHKIPPLV